MADAAYDLSYIVPGAGRQSVGSADRRLCAGVAALASYQATGELYGVLRGADPDDVAEYFADLWTDEDVPAPVAQTWASSINGAKLTDGVPAVVDLGNITLDDYQLHTIGQLLRSGGVLSLGCGLGKTFTAIAAANTWAAHHAPANQRPECVIACPLNAVPTWEKWQRLLRGTFRGPFGKVTVVSIDSLHKVANRRYSPGVVIFDEVHLLGDTKARRTKAAHRFRASFDFGLCLTGTLLHGGIEKALSVLDLAIPGAAGFATRWKAGEYFHCLAQKKLGSRTVTALEKPAGVARERFVEYLSRYTVALTKTSAIVRETLDLPPQHLNTVELGTPWQSLTQDVVDYAEQYIEQNGELPHMQHVAHALCRAGVDEKVDWLLDQMDDPLVQVVVFAAYRETLDRVEERFKADDVSYVRVDGDVTGADRAECQQKFQDRRVQVFLGQMDAACTAMDLFSGYVSVALDHSWRAANYDQALARTCRRGQTRDCFHFDLVANRMQAQVLARLRTACDFDASVEEWQEGKRALASTLASATEWNQPVSANTPPEWESTTFTFNDVDTGSDESISSLFVLPPIYKGLPNGT